MLVAWEVYGEARYRESAERGGEFLIRAQLPDPQPAWAQQYDRRMHPVWEPRTLQMHIDDITDRDAPRFDGLLGGRQRTVSFFR